MARKAEKSQTARFAKSMERSSTIEGVVYLEDMEIEESGSFVVWIRLQLGVDLGYECCGSSREHSSVCVG